MKVEETAVRLLKNLVNIDSTIGSNGEVTALGVLRDFFQEHGLSSEINEYRPENANLIAEIRRGDGPTLMFNSHIDVVPAGAGWTNPPFVATEQSNRIYGRGTADAKGSLAAMAVAFILAAKSTDWQGKIIFTAVGDEEVGSSGVRALMETVKADACVVGEPTNLRLLAAHKGSLRPQLKVQGIAAHAAVPWQGENAILGAGFMLELLAEYAQGLQAVTHPLTGHPTATPVQIVGGEAPNAVPETCVITVDRRMIPGETESSVRAEFEQIVSDFNQRGVTGIASIAGFAESTGGPSETEMDAPIVLATQEALSTLGLSSEPGGLQVNCDMATFRAHGIPTIVLGPGTLEVMHAKDEYIDIDQLVDATRVYGAIVREYLRAS